MRGGVFAKVWCCLLKHFAKRLPKVMAKYMHLFSLSSLRQSLEIPILGLSRSNYRSSINKSITNVNTWDKVSRYFYIMNNSFKFFITFFFLFVKSFPDPRSSIDSWLLVVMGFFCIACFGAVLHTVKESKQDKQDDLWRTSWKWNTGWSMLNKKDWHDSLRSTWY